MGLELKSLLMSLLFFFCGWVALSHGTSTPGICVRFSVCTVKEMAMTSMNDSKIFEEMAEAATKNQGSSKAIKGIKGLKVKDIQPPIIIIVFIEHKGMSMEVTSEITIAGKSFIGGNMEIKVKFALIIASKMYVQENKMLCAVTLCTVKLISCKTNLPSSMLPKIVNKFLNSTLSKVLPGMMCPAADKVVIQMNAEMKDMWEPKKIGIQGFFSFSPSGNPEISKYHALVCFLSKITRPNGEEVEISTGTTDVGVLPEMEKDDSEVTVRVEVLNAFLVLYKESLNQEVNSDTAGVESMISVDALREKVPELQVSVTWVNLLFKIRCPSNPTWSLEEGLATLIIPLTMELVEGPQENSVFLVAVELKISATFILVNGAIRTVLGDSRMENLQDISAALGTFDPETFSSYLLAIVRVKIIPALEMAMQDGIPLPNMMGSGYGDTKIEIFQNILRLTVISSCK